MNGAKEKNEICLSQMHLRSQSEQDGIGQLLTEWLRIKCTSLSFCKSTPPKAQSSLLINRELHREEKCQPRELRIRYCTMRELAFTYEAFFPSKKNNFLSHKCV